MAVKRVQGSKGKGKATSGEYKMTCQFRVPGDDAVYELVGVGPTRRAARSNLNHHLHGELQLTLSGVEVVSGTTTYPDGNTVECGCKMIPPRSATPKAAKGKKAGKGKATAQAVPDMSQFTPEMVKAMISAAVQEAVLQTTLALGGHLGK